MGSTDTAVAGSGQDVGDGFGIGGLGQLSGSLPSLFKRHLVSRFSVGQVYESGISNGNYSNASDTHTEASASFLYDLARKHSVHTFEYHGSARHYNRIQEATVLV